MKKRFWSEGIRFECQGSGNCCVSRGGYGHVFLTKDDRKAIAKNLNLRASVFTKMFCEKESEIWKLKDGLQGECVFLRERKCSIYKARPIQCRTWPFWPEVLNARTWNKEVASFCPGVGKGRVWSEPEIQGQLRIQIESEEKHGS